MTTHGILQTSEIRLVVQPGANHSASFWAHRLLAATNSCSKAQGRAVVSKSALVLIQVIRTFDDWAVQLRREIPLSVQDLP